MNGSWSAACLLATLAASASAAEFCVRAANVSQQAADVHLTAAALTVSGGVCELTAEVVDAGGKVTLAFSASKQASADGVVKFAQQEKLVRPHLWSVDDPHLYTVRCALRCDGKVIAENTLTLGVREFRFDRERQRLLLNGDELRLRGWRQPLTVNAPDWVLANDIKLMKAGGGNVVRWENCEPPEASLSAGDRLGYLNWLTVSGAAGNHPSALELSDSDAALLSAVLSADAVPSTSRPLDDNYFRAKVINSDDPQIHIMGHWNHAAPLTVSVCANTDEVELFVNDESLGKKPVRDFRAVWDHVPFVAGRLKAIGYNGGSPDCNDERVTAGVPVKILVEAQTSPEGLCADGQDVAFVTATIVDAEENPCLDADNQLAVNVSGAGVLVGKNTLPAEAGKIRVAVRSTKQVGAIAVTVSADGLESGTTEILSNTSREALWSAVVLYRFGSVTLLRRKRQRTAALQSASRLMMRSDI